MHAWLIGYVVINLHKEVGVFSVENSQTDRPRGRRGEGEREGRREEIGRGEKDKRGEH